MINQLEGVQDKPKPDFLLLDNVWVSKASFPDVMNDHYITVAKDLSCSAPPEIVHQPLEEVPISTVKYHLKRLNPRKSSRTIPSWFFKEGCEDLAVVVSNIINSCLTNCTFPDVWKIADVTAIEKDRPILSKAQSGLFPFSTALERLLNALYATSINMLSNNNSNLTSMLMLNKEVLQTRLSQ